VSTTNVLCPSQEEFNLPAYSWYPAPLKRYCERLSITRKPSLANHAKYPAVNWFSFYELRAFLQPLNFHSLDRFDLVDVAQKGALSRVILAIVRTVPVVRLLAYVVTPSTYLVAVKSTAKCR
jgi:2-polyprenyl-6-hydroxyphenyl methylase/3-demethylubiquinone-9 3-methyltransferase